MLIDLDGSSFDFNAFLVGLGGFVLKDVSGYLIRLVDLLWLSDKKGRTFENHLSSGKVHGVSTVGHLNAGPLPLPCKPILLIVLTCAPKSRASTRCQHNCTPRTCHLRTHVKRLHYARTPKLKDRCPPKNAAAWSTLWLCCRSHAGANFR